jgi:type I restriction enzyme S subunit
VLAKAAVARFQADPTVENLEYLFHRSFSSTPADLRKSILVLAVQGALVPQDPNDETAEDSIECVRKDAKKAIRDGIIRRHGIDGSPNDAGLADLPSGWRWTRLLEVARPVPHAIKRGPFGSAIRKDMFVPTGFKVYEQQHAISGDFTKGRYYINEARFDELSAFELHPDEILVSCSGTVGRVAIVPAHIERGIINQALLKLSLHQSALLNEYFLILFPAFFMETETLTNLSGTAQKNIPGMDVLKAMPFPLPPLAEQRRIVTKVNELMALVDQHESQITASEEAGTKLLDALVFELAPSN